MLAPSACGLDAADEVLDDRQVDVGLEKRQADLAQAGVDVGLGEVPVPRHLLQRGHQFVLQLIEHRTEIIAARRWALVYDYRYSPARRIGWISITGTRA